MVQRVLDYLWTRAALLLEQQQHYCKQLNRWFLSEQGLHVASAVTKELMSLKSILTGDHCIQLGLCGKNPWLSYLPFSCRFIITPWDSRQAQVASSLTQLPFDRNSIDCILSPFILDAFSASKKPLDELDRILKPMGHIIFIGINPFSFWGLWLRMSQNSCFGAYHHWSQAVLTLKQTMAYRGYVQVHLSSFYYVPPFQQAKWLHRFEILNEIGRLVSPQPSAFYCLVMQKYQKNPIRPIPITMKQALAVS